MKALSYIIWCRPKFLSTFKIWMNLSVSRCYFKKNVYGKLLFVIEISHGLDRARDGTGLACLPMASACCPGSLLCENRGCLLGCGPVTDA